jgi:hypothetical protein
MQKQQNGQPKQNGDEDYKRHVEATFARYDAVMKDRDALREQLNTAINTLKQATDTEVLLRDEIISLRRQLEDANLHTIQAMAERAAYETLFSGFMAQMREFKVPAVPLVRTASMDEQQSDV